MNNSMLNEADIREALRACFDTSGRYPGPVNIVDMGLVEWIELSVDEDAPGAGIAGVPAKQRLRLTLIAAGEDEDARALMQAQVSNRLAGLPELSKTEVLFVSEPMWTPERISGEGRRLLGLDAVRFPILNNRRR